MKTAVKSLDFIQLCCLEDGLDQWTDEYCVVLFCLFLFFESSCKLTGLTVPPIKVNCEVVFKCINKAVQPLPTKQYRVLNV